MVALGPLHCHLLRHPSRTAVADLSVGLSLGLYAVFQFYSPTCLFFANFKGVSFTGVQVSVK